MEPFVLKILKRLRKEAPRKFKDLRISCDELIAALTEKESANGGESQETDADQYFEPLEMACQTRQPRLMEISLDSIHYLIEHGYMRGKKKIDSIAAERMESASESKSYNHLTLMDLIIETVSKCSDEIDDGVQLQVIKVLLTAITSLHCEVHEASLLLSIRACFHIHLISKNLINKTTAKAALTQMLSVINQRMEINDIKGTGAAAGTMVTAGALGGSIIDPIAAGDPTTAAATTTASTITTKIVRAAVSLKKTAFDIHNNHDVDDDTIDIVPETANNSISGSVENDSDAVTTRDNNNVHDDATSTTAITVSKVAASSTDDIIPPHLSSAVASASGGSNLQFPSIFHKDAYLLFRALCKLSMKGLNEEVQYAHITDAIPLQNKLLSLELILHIMNNIGPAFRTGDKFIYAIRSYLCVSLLSNCTSHITQVAGLSLQLFVVLVDQFKDHLKNEIEVFVSTIFLRMIDSENCAYDHKLKILEVFHAICRDPKFLVEIFINFDCDLESADIFSRMVTGFSKIAKNPSLSAAQNRTLTVDFMSSVTKKSQQEEFQIRYMGLEGLVIILNSLTVSAGLSNGVTMDLASPIAAGGSSSGGVEQHQQTSSSLPLNTYQEVDEDHVAILSATSPTQQQQHLTNNSNVTASNAVEKFDKKQKLYEELETGILKFNLNPKNGLSYLAKSGHLEMTPKSVADFLHLYQDRLDKTSIGDYLGREREYLDGFCLKVLHEYCEILDFSKMPFDLAIRHFLNGFRLPGEAQKIDRIMEKFAERYYLQNRDTFASADMAFILAFSTIMLQTNLHNPAIRDDKRMTKEQFIKQNKGISADGELSDELLMEIYDRIAAQPISIKDEDKGSKKKEDHPTTFVMFQATTEKRKKDAFNNERKEMVKAGEALMKLNIKRNGSNFIRNPIADGVEAYSRPMYEVVWPPMIGVLSQIFEMYDDPSVVQLCLDGFRSCIMLSCRLDIPVARNTFINALLKFTVLDGVKEMKIKNVTCIKMLINISLSEGDFLEDSWVQVLQNVSQLARLQLLASGSHTDDVLFSASSSNEIQKPSMRRASVNSDAFTKLFIGVTKAEVVRATEEANADLVMSVIDVVVVDHLYLHSVHLNGESVKHFVRSLCEVSMSEITASSTMNSLRGKESSADTAAPRIFSLQKLVEVADCNMFTRSRMDWSSIWNLLAKHFSAIGLHENLNIAMYAIDSLKQLSIKFLQKEELSNFNFQRVFLTPFEQIMSKTKSSDIRFLIINCMEVMIRSCAGNIHSGWRSIFAIFTVAASQEILDIATSAYNVIYQLISNQFLLLIYDFVELINCLVSFVTSYHTVLSLSSLENIALCADNLANGLINPAVHTQNASSDTMGISWEKSKPIVDDSSVGEDASVFRLWWPLLLGLSTSVADMRLQVRTKALETLSLVLRKHGKLFSSQAWSVIFKGVLFPIIDSAKTDSTKQPKSAYPTENPLLSRNPLSWIGTMGLSVLMSFIELYKLFGTNNETTTIFMLSDLLSLFDECINQEIEVLAKIGLTAMSSLILSLTEYNSNINNNGSSDINDETTVANNNNSLPQYQLNLICKKVSENIVRNLCLDFADVGTLSLHYQQIPMQIKSLLPRCPITYRCNLKMSNNEKEMISHNNNHDADSTTSAAVESKIVDKSREMTWIEKSVPAMTSMVISLDFIRLVKEMLHTSSYTWSLIHFESFLNALETSHWHAYCFNENSSLRLQLQQRGFMNKNRSGTNISSALPHLLEQEVQSMEQLLFTVFQLYCYNKHRSSVDATICNTLDGVEAESFAEPWVERLSAIVLNRYLSYEEVAIRKNKAISSSSSPIDTTINSSDADSYSSDEEDGDGFSSDHVISFDEFLRHRHESYKSPTLIVLEGMMDFTHQQVQNNLTWIVPLLSRLIICEDIEVRLCVRQIYQSFINFLLIK